MTGGLIRREKGDTGKRTPYEDTEIQRGEVGEVHVKMEPGIGFMMPKARSHQKLGEARKDPPLEVTKEA